MQYVPIFPHNFGFKPFGAANRAVVVGPGATGALATAGSSLNLGLSWRILMRVRRVVSTAAYVTQYMRGVSDVFGVIHGVVGDVYELYSADNASGGTVRLALTRPVPDNGFHDVEFAYSGTAASGTLSAFLDGTPAGTLSVANFAPGVVNAATLELAGRVGNNSFAGAVSSLLIEAGGAKLVDLRFEEESGNALNTGTLGGEMVFTNGGIRETL